MNNLKILFIIFFGFFISIGNLEALVTKNTICHVDEETGVAKLMALPLKAAQSHLSNHADDAVPGGTSQSGKSYNEYCVEAPPDFVFIRVYREDYQNLPEPKPEDASADDYDIHDLLYVEVVDTSIVKGSLGAGDTIKVHNFPTDFGVGTLNVGAEHIVNAANITNPNNILLFADGNGGTHRFRFDSNFASPIGLFYDNYAESIVGDIATVSNFTETDFSLGQEIRINPQSPSEPQVEDIIFISDPDNTTDDPWLEVRSYEPSS